MNIHYRRIHVQQSEVSFAEQQLMSNIYIMWELLGTADLPNNIILPEEHLTLKKDKKSKKSDVDSEKVQVCTFYLVLT